LGVKQVHRQPDGAPTATKGVITLLLCSVCSPYSSSSSSSPHTPSLLTQARPGAPTGTYNLVPAGLAQTKRRFLAARFPEKVCMSSAQRDRLPCRTLTASAPAGAEAVDRAMCCAVLLSLFSAAGRMRELLGLCQRQVTAAGRRYLQKTTSLLLRRSQHGSSRRGTSSSSSSRRMPGVLVLTGQIPSHAPCLSADRATQLAHQQRPVVLCDTVTPPCLEWSGTNAPAVLLFVFCMQPPTHAQGAERQRHQAAAGAAAHGRQGQLLYAVKGVLACSSGWHDSRDAAAAAASGGGVVCLLAACEGRCVLAACCCAPPCCRVAAHGTLCCSRWMPHSRSSSCLGTGKALRMLHSGLRPAQGTQAAVTAFCLRPLNTAGAA
jgi:hypothetical protein